MSSREASVVQDLTRKIQSHHPMTNEQVANRDRADRRWFTFLASCIAGGLTLACFAVFNEFIDMLVIRIFLLFVTGVFALVCLLTISTVYVSWPRTMPVGEQTKMELLDFAETYPELRETLVAWFQEGLVVTATEVDLVRQYSAEQKRTEKERVSIQKISARLTAIRNDLVSN